MKELENVQNAVAQLQLIAVVGVAVVVIYKQTILHRKFQVFISIMFYLLRKYFVVFVCMYFELLK